MTGGVSGSTGSGNPFDNDHWHPGEVEFPVLAWIRLKNTQRAPAKIAFKPYNGRFGDDALEYARKRMPIDLDFIGIDQKCDATANWSVLCEYRNKKPISSSNETRYCVTDKKKIQFLSFRCLGLRIRKTRLEQYMGISDLNMWSWVV